jgi:hypothetical protein
VHRNRVMENQRDEQTEQNPHGGILP